MTISQLADFIFEMRCPPRSSQFVRPYDFPLELALQKPMGTRAGIHSRKTGRPSRLDTARPRAGFSSSSPWWGSPAVKEHRWVQRHGGPQILVGEETQRKPRDMNPSTETNLSRILQSSSCTNDFVEGEHIQLIFAGYRLVKEHW